MNAARTPRWRARGSFRIIRRMRLPALAALAAALFTACSDPALQKDSSGKHALLAQTDAGKHLAALLAQHGKANVVFAHTPELGREALAAMTAEQRGKVRLVVAGVPTAEAKALVADGTFDATAEQSVQCGDAALALAAMAARRIDVHRHFALGVCWFTKANLAADGARVPAPGDLALQVLRLQHPAPPVTNDALLQIICIADGSSAWCRAALADFEAKGKDARRHPGLALVSKTVDKTDELAAALDGTASANPAAVVLITTAAAGSEAARQRALARACKVIVIGQQPTDEHYTSHVGPDPETIGRAAGAAIQQLRPDDARILELTHSTAVHDGFAKALGLRAAR